MNINKLTPGIGGGGQTRSTEKAPSSAGNASETGKSTGTDVKLSPQSKSIQQIEAEVSKMPDIDNATVERIKGALANNEYKIDYERIAGQMIKFDSLLN